jgi:hypothetical protein
VREAWHAWRIYAAEKLLRWAQVVMPAGKDLDRLNRYLLPYAQEVLADIAARRIARGWTT